LVVSPIFSWWRVEALDPETEALRDASHAVETTATL
jgi:hypothetical protein